MSRTQSTGVPSVWKPWVPSSNSTRSTASGARVVIPRPIAERLPSGRDRHEVDARHREQRPPQRLEPLRVDAVVVGEEHAHGA